MARFLLMIGFLLFLPKVLYSQIYYDDGPIVDKSFSPLWVPEPGERTWECRIIRYFYVNGTGDISGNNERGGIRQAMDIWEEHTFLRFVEVTNEANADIRILWGIGDHGDPCACDFDGTNNTLAHAFFPPPNLGEFAGDVHFDDAETWTLNMATSDSQPIDLVTVAAHELGHSLGLDHTTVPNSLMNATYTGSQRLLGADDIAGIQDLYGPPIQISGSDLLCSSGSYTLLNLPAGSTATWSVTPSGQFTGSTSGSGTTATLTPSSTAAAQATLTYTITTACGNTQVQRVFWVGKPATPPTPGVLENVPPNRFTVYLTPPTEQGVTSYNWYVGGILQSGEHNATIRVPWKYPHCGNSYLVEVEAVNSCGISTKRSITLFDPPCFSGYSLRISPNPGESEVEIAVIGVPNSMESKESKQQEQLIEEEAGELVLYDRLGNQLFQQQLQGGKATIDIRNLKPGTYVVKYFSPEGVLEGKLLKP